MTNLPNKPRAFCLKNNSAQTVSEVTEPWLNTVPIPAFHDKNEYRAWCKHPSTDYCFFSLIEGVNAVMRTGAGNQPYKVHGLVGDYDAHDLSDEEIKRGLSRMNKRFAPYAWNRTFSGGMRVVWLFEEPVFFYNKDTFKKFVNRCIREIKAKDLYPHLDDHIFDYQEYYCAGNNWIVNPFEPTIGSNALSLWISDASAKDDFNDEGLEIPIEKIAAKVEEKFPGRWEGEFKLGARGIRFWDPSADANSVIVRPTGCQCFTGDKPFMSWAAIFGAEFVKEYQENRIGAAVREIYHDSQKYYRRLPAEVWAPMDVTSARRHLIVGYGLAEDEAEAALHKIELTKNVAAAAPFALNPQTIVEFNGRPYLNTQTAKAVVPAPEAQEWGVNFPWLADFLDHFFIDDFTKKHFLSWLHLWYKGVVEGRQTPGHQIYIAGGANLGKTFLSRCVLNQMFGGYIDASQFLVDGNQYNDNLFEKVVWAIDDADLGQDRKVRARLTAALKAIAVNGTFRYQKKYGASCSLPIFSRVVVTLNNDFSSSGILPNADQSGLDKISFYLAGNTPFKSNGSYAANWDIVARELPFFAKYVLDYEIPASIKRDDRLGICAYHATPMLQKAQALSQSVEVRELIESWMAEYAKNNPAQKYWKGTTTKIHANLSGLQETASSMRNISAVFLGRLINDLVDQQVPWIKRLPKSNGNRFVEIDIQLAASEASEATN